MLDEYKPLELVNNQAEHRFELRVGDHTAFIEYRQASHTITLLHTEVPEQLEGKGAATAVIEKTLRYIEKNNFNLVPLCPFVVAYLKRHPDWKRIVDGSVKNL